MNVPAHESHQKQGKLDDVVGYEVEAIDDAVVPRCLIEIEDIGQQPQQDFDADDLGCFK